MKTIENPFFPVTFLVRNILVLEKEFEQSHEPIAVKRARITKVVTERVLFFQEVRHWLLKRRDWNPLIVSLESNDQSNLSPDESYCFHCGGCCEIPGGLPDFPHDVPIPRWWQDIFGRGLGKGHRFCPFLWEDHRTGASLCAIHPWRPYPCRLFEEEECRFLQNDSDFVELNNQMELFQSRFIRR